MSLTTTSVLGKRKNRTTAETLLLQLSASESNHEQSDVSWESEVESTKTLPDSKQKPEFVLVNGSLVKNAKKKYHCTFPGCEKLYTKPCRLEEHERSHTGEVCFFFYAFDTGRLSQDRRGRSCARLAINLIYEKLISKPMPVPIYLIPIAPLSAPRKVA